MYLCCFPCVYSVSDIFKCLKSIIIQIFVSLYCMWHIGPADDVFLADGGALSNQFGHWAGCYIPGWGCWCVVCIVHIRTDRRSARKLIWYSAWWGRQQRAGSEEAGIRGDYEWKDRVPAWWSLHLLHVSIQLVFYLKFIMSFPKRMTSLPNMCSAMKGQYMQERPITRQTLSHNKGIFKVSRVGNLAILLCSKIEDFTSVPLGYTVNELWLLEQTEVPHSKMSSRIINRSQEFSDRYIEDWCGIKGQAPQWSLHSIWMLGNTYVPAHSGRFSQTIANLSILSLNYDIIQRARWTSLDWILMFLSIDWIRIFLWKC